MSRTTRLMAIARTITTAIGTNTNTSKDPDGALPYTTPEGYVRVYMSATFYHNEAAAKPLDIVVSDVAMNADIAYLAYQYSLTNSLYVTVPNTEDDVALANRAWPAIVPAKGYLKCTLYNSAGSKTFRINAQFWEIPVDDNGQPEDELGRAILAAAV